MKLCVHLCADSIAGIVLFATDIQSQFAKEVDDTPRVPQFKVEST